MNTPPNAAQPGTSTLLDTNVAVDRFGNVYVADSGNHRVQTFVPH
ncbi:MAG: SBBP repeat-containing protein [Nitrososphaeraceae archaeon]